MLLVDTVYSRNERTVVGGTSQRKIRLNYHMGEEVDLLGQSKINRSRRTNVVSYVPEHRPLAHVYLQNKPTLLLRVDVGCNFR